MVKIITTSRGKNTQNKFTPMVVMAVLVVFCVAVLTRSLKSNGKSEQDDANTDLLKQASTNIFEKAEVSTCYKGSDVKPISANATVKAVEVETKATIREEETTNIIVEGIANRKVARPSGFNGGSFEKIACMIMSVSDEIDMPPTPLLPEEKLRAAFYNAITNDILVFDDDDEKTVALKERVAETKNQLAIILENGGTLTQALKEYEQWKKENKQIRDEVLKEYYRLCLEASDEDAGAYLLNANRELVAEGITPITMSLRDRLKLRKLSKESGDTATDEDTPALLQ